MDSSPPTSDPLHGLNPESLMASAAMATDGGEDTLPLAARDLPSLEEIAAAFPELDVQCLIGHGGMSAVFKARQPKLDRTIALKVLPKSLAATSGFAERFTREGRVLARLSHPNIVAVHDFGESGGFCFLIMEFVDGVNLRQAMRAGRFTPEQALNIIPAICDALQFAHSQGVLHRDIKPENILLDSKGRVKIADFGIAKILDEKGDAMLLTKSGAKLGTAPYMAPEQIEKPSSVDHRADIYSLGVVFYEMLTGELPLGRFAAPSEIAAVGGNIDEIVLRALEKERTRRQQSVSEFKTQVEGSHTASNRAAIRGDRWGAFEYKSKRTLWGMPLLHVVHGRDPATGKRRQAHGFFAFGELAKGVFAFGGIARGFFACGGLAVGVVSFGGLGVGLISVGGLAVGLLLGVGGVAVGALAMGGAALGWMASGGVAVGVYAHGGIVAGNHGMGGVVGTGEVVKRIADLPPMLQWMIRSSPYLGSLSLLWLPLGLLITLVPWWARKQLQMEYGEITREQAGNSSRMFWTIPAAILFCDMLFWLVGKWSTVVPGGITNLIIPTVICGMGLLLFVLALPLWLKLVPINPVYGVRLPSTMATEKCWFTVNAVFGKQLFWWSLLVLGGGIAGFYQLPRHLDAYAWASITLTLVAVVAAVVSTLVWMHRHPIGEAPRKPHRLLRNLELVLPVVVLMFFVRSFIGRPYIVPNGAEPGVAKNSRWIATHLNTGFVPGDLIAFEHESGRTWLARIVAVEPKGLRLKRGGSPDVFFMPWDKIVGKMLFSYLSPSATPDP
ncbi:MAG: protein kinase [Prosthecobacter sp.]